MLNLVWKDSRNNRDQLVRLFQLLPDILTPSEMFEQGPARQYQMRGMILYGMNHYITVMRNEENGRWYKYDDSRSEKLSGDLHDIVVYCVKSFFKPTVVFYEDRGEATKFDSSVAKWAEL
jgi:hypothetical protein